MKIQNTSGITQAFTFANVASPVLAANAFAILPDYPEVYADALRYQTNGWISIVEGPAHSSNIQSVGQPAVVEVVVTANPSDTQTVSIAGKVFEFDNNAAVTAGRTSVTIAASAKLSLDALATAVLANSTFAGWRKIGCTAHEAAGAVLFLAPPPTVDLANVVVAETLSAGTVLKRAAVAGDSFGQLVEFRTITTLPGDLLFVTALRSIKYINVEVRNSSGVIKAWDGVARFDGGIVTLDNSVNTDIVAADVVFLQAYGLQ